MDDGEAKAAWDAYERGDPALALSLWERLLASATDEADRDAVRHAMAYALVGLGRFDEARAIYHQLFEKTGSHVHLHQLGMVEREAGDLRRAAAIFEKEEGILPSGDRLALAANLYERALVASLREDRMEARTLARRCLAIGLETTDPVMHGCAFRLLADVTREADPERARRLYHRARAAFAQAGDAIACDEIDERLAGLA